jgi:hypothetical protein
MEKPIPPNPDTMTDEEFDKWLEAEFITMARKTAANLNMHCVGLHI